MRIENRGPGFQNRGPGFHNLILTMTKHPSQRGAPGLNILTITMVQDGLLNESERAKELERLLHDDQSIPMQLALD